MKQNFLPLFFLIFGVCCFFSQSQAVCPEAPNDNGICDTLNAEIFPSDQWIDFSTPSPHLVRLSFYVTHDLPNPVDSIAAFVFAMCYSHTNPAKYCSLTRYWNEILWHPTKLPRNIFRHLVIDGDTIHNWMMDRFEEEHGAEWNGIILDLNGISNIWICFIPSGSEDQRFGDANHVLLTTMTFRLEDTATICVDTCFWPPDGVGLRFARSDAVTYIPRDNMRYCANIGNAMRGDANGDQVINVTDVIYMMNYLFRHGPSPVSFVSGDANCDYDLGILDVVLLINYLYKEGITPGCFR
ncbi:MAG: dockerin type I repeat-containing protein [Candidatus Zixiibacteriota bacterium]